METLQKCSSQLISHKNAYNTASNTQTPLLQLCSITQMPKSHSLLFCLFSADALCLLFLTLSLTGWYDSLSLKQRVMTRTCSCLSETHVCTRTTPVPLEPRVQTSKPTVEPRFQCGDHMALIYDRYIYVLLVEAHQNRKTHMANPTRATSNPEPHSSARHLGLDDEHHNLAPLIHIIRRLPRTPTTGDSNRINRSAQKVV